MPQDRALVIAFSRCNAPGFTDEWSRWYDDVHLPALVTPDTADVVTRWQLSVPPVPGMPSIGFSHLALYEIRGGDVDARVDALLARSDELERDGDLHPNHCLIGVDALRAYGRHDDKPEPRAGLRGHVLAYVMCNRRGLEDEWNTWNDDIHMPDMLASNAFAAVSRWVRRGRASHGANFVTLYDVAGIDVEEAVERAAAVMPGIVASGRKHPCHVGAMTVTLVPAGRYGGAGYRA